jgi:hypothetical protein
MGDNWANEMTEKESQSMRTVLCALVTGLEVLLPWDKTTLRIRMDRSGAVYYAGTIIRLGEHTGEVRWMRLDAPITAFFNARLDAPITAFFNACQKLSQYSMESLNADIAMNEMVREQQRKRAKRAKQPNS